MERPLLPLALVWGQVPPSAKADHLSLGYLWGKGEFPGDPQQQKSDR